MGKAKEKKTTAAPRKVELRRAKGKWVILLKDEKALMSQHYRPLRSAQFRRTIDLSNVKMLVWAGVLGTTASKLETRLKEKEEITPAEAERIDLFEQVYARGIEAFGDEAKFNRWMEIESPPLGRLRPKDLVKNTSGLRRVMGELEDIAYGTYA